MIARIGRKDHDREELPPSTWRLQLRHLAKWMLVVVGILVGMAIWLALITMANSLGPRTRTIDCGVAEFHPDYTTQMRQACRERRSAKQ